MEQNLCYVCSMGKLLASVLLLSAACSQPGAKSTTAPRENESPVTETRFEAKDEVPTHAEVMPLLIKSELSLSVPDGQCPILKDDGSAQSLGFLASDSAESAEQQKTSCEISVGGFVCTTEFIRSVGNEFFVTLSYRVASDRMHVTELIDCKVAG